MTLGCTCSCTECADGEISGKGASTCTPLEPCTEEDFYTLESDTALCKPVGLRWGRRGRQTADGNALMARAGLEPQRWRHLLPFVQVVLGQRHCSREPKVGWGLDPGLPSVLTGSSRRLCNIKDAEAVSLPEDAAFSSPCSCPPGHELSTASSVPSCIPVGLSQRGLPQRGLSQRGLSQRGRVPANLTSRV